ncbi:MAG TPA: glycosyltransferase 87 family protein [Candidatus Woesebacteria bacterium]|nr:glycosyltransferase 87 family protein [Candidatus Woesebacteria bacterium]
MKEIKRIILKYKIHIFFVFFLILIISRTTYHSDLFNIAGPTSRIIGGDFSMSKESISGGGKEVYTSFFPPIFYFIDSIVYYPFVKLGIYKFDLNNLIPVDQLLSVGFLLKLRYLVLYVLSLFLIIWISKIYEKEEKNRNKIFLLWLLCPILIFVPFSWGNNDIYPIFLLLLFLLFSFKKKYLLAMVFLGLSAATKNFSLFLILPVSLILANKNIKNVFIYTSIAILVYLVPLLCYLNMSYKFLTAGGEGLYILERHFLDGPLFFPLIYFLTTLYLIIKQKITDSNKNEILVKYCFLILSLFYLTSAFIPHWFLWIMPFFVLTAYKNKKLFYLYILINTAFFIYIYAWSRNIDMNLFALVFPVINKVMTLSEFLSKFFPNFKVFELVFTLFFASFGCYLYLLFFNKNKILPEETLSEKEINMFSLFPLVLFLIICFAFVFGLTKIHIRNWYDLGLSPRGKVIDAIYNSGQFYQTFKSPKDELMGINLFLSTYEKKIITPYKLILYNSDCKTKILESEIKVDKINDNAYREVLFNQIKDSKDKEYCFTVEPLVKQVDTPITLNYSNNNSYDSGELIISGKKTKNEDIVFQLIY